MIIYYLLFFISLYFTSTLLSIEKTVEKAEPRERSAYLDEKIKTAREKAFQEELKIKRANEDIIEYKKEIKIADSQEKIELVKKRISSVEETIKDSLKEKQLQNETIEKLAQDKKKLVELQRKLEREATSIQSSSEQFAEKLQNCIKQKIYDLFHISPQKTPKMIDEQIEELSASIKKLITYEKIYFTSSPKTTPEDWEKKRTKSLEEKPGDSDFNNTYQMLIKKALELQDKLEKSIGKKVNAQSRTAGVNCSLSFFASEYVAQKAIEELDEASNYDN